MEPTQVGQVHSMQSTQRHTVSEVDSYQPTQRLSVYEANTARLNIEVEGGKKTQVSAPNFETAFRLLKTILRVINKFWLCFF